MAEAITTLPFVGRERELGRLLARLAPAGGGQGGVVLLAGEPGIGKTRIAEEFAAAAEKHGARVLWGRCLEGEGAPAFWPWTQLIRAHARTCDPDTLRMELGEGGADLAEIAPVLRERLPDLHPPPPMAPDPSRFRLFDAATRFLWNVASERPLVLILDDLHQADVPSLRLLEWVARELDGARHGPGGPKLLIVGTYRDTEVDDDHPFIATLTELVRLSGSERLDLRGLSQTEVARAIALSTDRAPTADLAAMVYAETEGNPFFVVEVLRLLVAEGALDRAIPAAGMIVPPTVRAVIGRRLARLSPEVRRLLGVASVEGREFSLGVLRRVTELDGDRLLALIAESEVARVITPVAETLDRYRFGHALFRETLYSGLPRAERVRLHGQVGEALALITAANQEPHLAELAHHFWQAAAGDAARAVSYARRAGDRALATYAYEEAVRHYALALRALEVHATGEVAEREAQRCELLLALAQAQSLDVSLDAARRTVLEAAALARRMPSPEPLVRAALSLDVPYPLTGVVYPHAITLLEEALERLGEGDSAPRARVLAALAKALYGVAGAGARRRALSAEAVRLARRLGDRSVLLHVLAGAWWAAAGPDQVHERLAIAAEVIELAQAAGRADLTLYGRMLRYSDLVVLGDISAMDREAAVYERLTGELRHAYADHTVNAMRVLRATLAGRFADAERILHTALIPGRRADDGSRLAAAVVDALPWRLEQGGEQDLLDQADTALASGVVPPRLPGLRCVRLLLLARLGRDAEAATELDHLAAAGFRDLPEDYTTLFCLALLAEVCAMRRDTERAAALYDLLLPYTDQFIVCLISGYLGAVARYLGLLAATLGRWEDVAYHFEHTLANNGRIGARAFLARTQYDYAEALLRSAKAEGGRLKDEGVRALTLLDEARRAADELDLPRLAADADRLLAEVHSEPSSFIIHRSSFPDRLTAREVEVLRLVAQHYSNNEIAAELVLSVRTVERHITNIYRKAGVQDRRQARAYARTHGLTDPD